MCLGQLTAQQFGTETTLNDGYGAPMIFLGHICSLWLWLTVVGPGFLICLTLALIRNRSESW